MLELFERELGYLRERARQVGAEFPEIAHLVSGRMVDPAVERLLQGGALLNARIAAELSAELPEILHPIFETLWPQYLRPMPATTLLEVSAPESALQKVYSLPSNAKVRSRKVDGRVATFRTSWPVELVPLSLLGVELRKPSAATLAYVLRLGVHEGVELSAAELTRLRFHLVGPAAGRAALHAALARHVERIQLGPPGAPPSLELPASALRVVGLAPEESLWEVAPTPLLGVHLLEELFFFRDKFFGFEVRGLERLPALPGTELELALHLRHTQARSLPIDPAELRLGVTPAVNIAEAARLDLDVGAERTEFRVVPPEGTRVHSVERVGAFDAKSGSWIDFLPMLSGRPSRKERELPRYELRRRTSQIDPQEVSVVVLDAEGRAQSPTAERLAVWATLTDGDLPLRLGEGDLAVPAQGTPAFLKLANLGRMRAEAPSAMARGRLMRLLSSFVAPLDALYSLEGLRRLLNDAQPEAQDLGDRLLLQAHAKRTERLVDRMMVPAVRLELVVEPSALGGPDELPLFGLVLREVLRRRGEVGQLELWIHHEGAPEPLVFR